MYSKLCFTSNATVNVRMGKLSGQKDGRELEDRQVQEDKRKPLRNDIQHPSERPWGGRESHHSVSAMPGEPRDPQTPSKDPEPYPGGSHILHPSSGRFLKPQALTFKIRHKLAVLRLAQICLSPTRHCGKQRHKWHSHCSQVPCHLSQKNHVGLAQGAYLVSKISLWAMLSKSCSDRCILDKHDQIPVTKRGPAGNYRSAFYTPSRARGGAMGVDESRRVLKPKSLFQGNSPFRLALFLFSHGGLLRS